MNPNFLLALGFLMMGVMFFLMKESTQKSIESRFPSATDTSLRYICIVFTPAIIGLCAFGYVGINGIIFLAQQGIK